MRDISWTGEICAYSSFLLQGKNNVDLKSRGANNIPCECGKVCGKLIRCSTETEVTEHHHHIRLYQTESRQADQSNDASTAASMSSRRLKHNRSGMVAVLGSFEALPYYIHTCPSGGAGS
jgi:hypothetical protein